MDIKDHHQKFQEIIKKYCLNEDKKAEEVANFLTKKQGKKISPEEFAKLFAMDEEDSSIFLAFVEKGLSFKEKHIDKR